jgi:hypothetical protein
MESSEKTEIKEQPEIIKRKKGRPRKDSTKDITLNKEISPQEKKKRGRKKKEINQDEVVKQKKKRGRKAAVKYFSSTIRKKIPLTTVIKNNNILHIDIKNDDQENIQLNNNTKNEINDNDNDNDNNNNNDNDYIDEMSISNINLNDKFPIEIKKILLEEDDNDISFSSEDDIKSLYQKRLEYREKQDEILISKLEKLHKDDDYIQSLISNHEENMNNDESNKKDLLKKKVSVQENNRKKGFFELLYNFVHNEEWLHKTDVCCWWCCHSFDTVPLGFPIEYSKELKKFKVKGVFCSFACLLAYKNDKKLLDKNHLINFLYTKLTADYSILENKSILTPAPPRYTLKMFGGELNIDEFRNSSNEGKIYKMIEYPLCIYKDYVEEIDIANVKNANSKLFNKDSLSKLSNLDEKRIYDAQSRLSQSQSTTITLGNTIDKFIKLT